ncbi:uncharacterized protein V1518DRAFT_410344 [Limtongia smithiae]|uniref:uncharacterized protein n=1 Tax=Limtongia smithiae TaxID=1125753 RepID=UPI0034CD49A0
MASDLHAANSTVEPPPRRRNPTAGDETTTSKSSRRRQHSNNGAKVASVATPQFSVGSENTAPIPILNNKNNYRQPPLQPQSFPDSSPRSWPTMSMSSPLILGAMMPATPTRSVMGADRYAGPTFHSSPAPTQLPMPKFMARVSGSADISSLSLSDEPDDEALAVVDDVETETPTAGPMLEASPIESATVAVFPENKTAMSSLGLEAATAHPELKQRSSRFGDSVVFRPRRKALSANIVNQPSTTLTAASSPAEHAANMPSSAPASQRRAPADFDFLFAAASSSSLPRTPTRKPRDFDRLLNRSPTPRSPTSAVPATSQIRV